MKRKFILLPITLTALIPAITLVGCGDPDTPEPKPTDEIIVDDWESSGDYLFKFINFENNQKYCFLVDQKFLTENRLVFVDASQSYIFLKQGGVSVKIDDEWLDMIIPIEDFLSCESGFCVNFNDDSKTDFIQWKHNKIKQNSIVKIYFISKEKMENVKVCIM